MAVLAAHDVAMQCGVPNVQARRLHSCESGPPDYALPALTWLHWRDAGLVLNASLVWMLHHMACCCS